MEDQNTMEGQALLPVRSAQPGQSQEPALKEGQGEGDSGLTPQDSGLAALQSTIASLTADLETERSGHAASRDQLAAASQQLEQSQAALTAAAARYRDALLASNPAIPPELLTGDSIDAVDASLEAARTIVQSVIARAQPAAHGAQPPSAVPVPAGAPVRAGPDTSAMSPTEKIRYALATERHP